MYIISGNHHSKGIIGDDCSDIKGYWELGWECGVSNIYIKQFLIEGKIKKTDTIVTRSGREFFYSSLFDNVISWDDFVKLDIKDDILSIPDMLDISKLLEYDYLNVDKDIVCDFDLDKGIEQKYQITDDFVIYCVRLREHGSYRNTDISVAKKSILFFKEEGYKVFIVGQGAEFLEDELDVKCLDLFEYCSLMSSSRCRLCISTLSGIIHLSNFCGHKNLNVFVLDHHSERKQNNHPLYMGDNINYKEVKTRFINGPENYENIKELYLKYIKK